jgi:hypothetical protein
MLTKSATYTLENEDGFKRIITVVPLFFQNHQQPWQPNEIYELKQEGTLLNGEVENFPEPHELGKIIVDEHKEWHYEGEGDIPDEDIEKIAQMVLAEEE